ncbi:hypothetical protein [Nocardia farcinica]|uniref:hypothetical protein n=1 Tax=Nocardia farcinica TaxID=37329 RepID=UPI0024579EFA|nr:hypothetical protein [Nocardia farcinica]
MSINDTSVVAPSAPGAFASVPPPPQPVSARIEASAAAPMVVRVRVRNVMRVLQLWR